MTNTNNSFRNTLTAVVAAVLMTTTSFAIAVSPAVHASAIPTSQA